LINLDTNTALAFVAENSSVRYQLQEFVSDEQLVIAQTAFDEFTNIVQRSGGASERSRAERFLQRVTLVPDNPSLAAQALQPTRNLDVNDIIILGTGDRLGIVTMTADVRAVRAASAQGVDFDVYLHPPYPLMGT
jgi:predicted nucleic acid-binding protein